MDYKYPEYKEEKKVKTRYFSKKDIAYLRELIIAGITIDGAHHKQWYLEKIAKFLKISLPIDREHGLAP